MSTDQELYLYDIKYFEDFIHDYLEEWKGRLNVEHYLSCLTDEFLFYCESVGKPMDVRKGKDLIKHLDSYNIGGATYVSKMAIHIASYIWGDHK